MGQWHPTLDGAMSYFADIYRGKRVLVTGHTGFKGSWLCAWLQQLGAEVAGFSREVVSEPSHFALVGLESSVQHFLGDIRDAAALNQVIDTFRPEVIFHLAAQALVRRSYEDPAESFATNAMGMVHLLDAIRARPWIQAAVLITSDKAYRNVEWCWGYRETDALGGFDPYGASKSCADIIAQCYQKAFLQEGGTAVAIARAGNVIGGGDWAADRIVPDAIRAWSAGQPVMVRSPNATRPWQHVLEPLSGYLWLGAALLRRQPNARGEAYNFGPDAAVNQTVGELLAAMASQWPGAVWHTQNAGAQGEAMLLKLSCDKALHDLKWRPLLSFEETVALTAEWYLAWHQKQPNMLEITRRQIAYYASHAERKGFAWASQA